jgi:hypothetical protein
MIKTMPRNASSCCELFRFKRAPGSDLFYADEEFLLPRVDASAGSRDLTLVIPATTNQSPDDYQQPIRFPIPSPTDPNTMVSGCTWHGPAAVCQGCRCPSVAMPAIDQGDWSLWQVRKRHFCAILQHKW